VRIVSLVPSVTESLFVLGLGERVVGVTDFCIHPTQAVAALPKLGGTKNPDIEKLAALHPDLVIANQEENTRRVVERLRGLGIEVWVTYPRRVREAAALLRELWKLGGSPETLTAVIEPVERAVAEAERRRSNRPTRFFCAIWKDPWMTAGRDTYIHDLLTLCGGENIFAAHSERRYPRVTLSEVEAAAPEVILLPDEPYCFKEEDAQVLAELAIPAARSDRIHCVDGSLVSWHGPRLLAALPFLQALFAEEPSRPSSPSAAAASQRTPVKKTS